MPVSTNASPCKEKIRDYPLLVSFTNNRFLNMRLDADKVLASPSKKVIPLTERVNFVAKQSVVIKAASPMHVSQKKNDAKMQQNIAEKRTLADPCASANSVPGLD